MASLVNAFRLNDAADQRNDQSTISTAILAQVDRYFIWLHFGNFVVEALCEMFQSLLWTVVT